MLKLNCYSVVSETTKRNKLQDDDATHEAKSMKYSPDRKTCMSKLIRYLSLLVLTSKPDFKHGAPGLSAMGRCSVPLQLSLTDILLVQNLCTPERATGVSEEKFH